MPDRHLVRRRTIIHTRDMSRRAEETAVKLSAEISAKVDERIGQASAALEEKIDEASRQSRAASLGPLTTRCVADLPSSSGMALTHPGGARRPSAEMLGTDRSGVP